MQESTFTTPSHLLVTTRQRGDAFAANCPTRHLLDRIADKWSTLILLTLSNGDMRFNGLKRRVEGISQKMLSQTLRSLERDGLVTRTVEASVPVTVTYSITSLGEGLIAALQSMIDWAETCMIEVTASQRAYDFRNTGDAFR